MSSKGKIPTSSLHDDNQHWLTMWQERQIEFHQTSVNLLLERFWKSLELKRNTRVLVPLCGKSLDMLWLAAQGHQVIGIELSPIAVKAFFSEAGIKVKKQRIGNFIRWQSGNITIWCGDYFALTQQQLGIVDVVFDRAALTALPQDIRTEYIKQLRTLTTNNTDIFLLTVEDDIKDKMTTEVKKLKCNTVSGDHYLQAIDKEVASLCSLHFHIELIHAEVEIENTQSSLITHKKAYKLTAKIDPKL